MAKSYEIIDHQYDVVVVGAGGAGIRAAPELASIQIELVIFKEDLHRAGPGIGSGRGPREQSGISRE